jgi:hypothetical protein
MGDLIQQLIDDHRTIEELCDRFCATLDRDVLILLCHELESHDAAEAAVVDRLIELDLPMPRARQIVADARDERENRRVAIETVRGATDLPTAEVGRVLALALHHTLTQENSVFPQIREHCSRADLVGLGRRLTEAKELIASWRRRVDVDVELDPER